MCVCVPSVLSMDNTGYCNDSFNSIRSSTSDEDMVEIAGATLDFSNTEDVPPLDRDKCCGKTNACLCCIDFTHTSFVPKQVMGIANVLFYLYYFTPECVTLLNPHVSPFSSRG